MIDRLTRAKELCQHFYLSQGFMEAPEWDDIGKDFQNGFLALADQSRSQESVRSEAKSSDEAVRDAALEEAAKVCEREAEAHRSAENHKMRTPAGRQGAIAQEMEARNCATLIRALIGMTGGEDRQSISTEQARLGIDNQGNHRAPESPAKEQPGEQNIVNWTTEGCPKHHGLSWTMGATLAYTQIAKRCPLCEPPPPERP